MNAIALVSSDERIVTEVAAAASVVGAALRHHSSCHEVDTDSSTIVFVDAQAQGTSSHPRVVIVCFGPAGPQEWMAASMRGAHKIIELPNDRAALTELLTETPIRKRATIAVLPLVSGCGSSTMAVAMAAQVAQRGQRTLLVDGDPNGGLDIIAGIENVPGTRWPEAIRNAHANLALPVIRELALLSSDVRATLCMPQSDVVARWGDTYECVMWDLAAGSQELLALVDPDLVVSVVPNTVRAAAVAKRVSGELSARRHGLVVRTIAGAAIEPMEIAELLDIPLWGVVPSDSRVVEQVEQGLGPAAINLGGFTRSVTAIVDRLVDHAPER